MSQILENSKKDMDKTLETLSHRFATVRAGRANPSSLDGVMVEYYGTPTPLKSLATITVPEARILQIKPFDKSCLQAIEKGIYEANIGLTPNNNGEIIILNIPARCDLKNSLYPATKLNFLLCVSERELYSCLYVSKICSMCFSSGAFAFKASRFSYVLVISTFLSISGIFFLKRKTGISRNVL